jgi:hypothetical protein
MEIHRSLVQIRLEGVYLLFGQLEKNTTLGTLFADNTLSNHFWKWLAEAILSLVLYGPRPTTVGRYQQMAARAVIAGVY